VRYLATQVYTLESEGYGFEGDRIPYGQIWVSEQGRPIILPDPDLDVDGVAWFVAEIVDDILKDRWSGLAPATRLQRFGNKDRLELPGDD
jgi:hypothetical protein